ncbi:hypothetical protein MRX96_025708 [Rhipicephalus microplus]
MQRAMFCRPLLWLIDLKLPLELDLERLLNNSDAARMLGLALRVEHLLEWERLLGGVAGSPPALVGAGDTSRFLEKSSKDTSLYTNCAELWQRYLQCKRAMQAIVQRKIAEHNGKQLKALTEDRRNGSRQFWTYVSSLDTEDSHAADSK